MTKALIVVSILLVVTLLVIIGFVTGVIQLQSKPTSQIPASVALSTSASIPVLTSIPTSTLTTPTPVPSQSGNVRFGFAVTDVSGSGFSRTVTAELSNTGTADAHNVWAKVEASVGGSGIRLNGQDHLRVDIGTLKAGDSVTKQVTLNFSMAEALSIELQGIHLDLTILSDEYSEIFSYNYKP